jgi:Type VI secretion system/phage-baseplate injector OB domain
MNIEQRIKEFGLEDFGKFYSSYKGFVFDNQDPLNLGRLKLKVPEVWGEEILDYWALPKGMFSGNAKGFYNIPSVGDNIWVEFEKGDPNFPIWNYGWFSQNEPPTNAKPEVFIWQSKEGQRIELNDSTGEVKLTDKNGLVIQLKNDKVFIGKGNSNIGSLMAKLFMAFSNTKTATLIGAQPFINIAEYEALKQEFSALLSDSL